MSANFAVVDALTQFLLGPAEAVAGGIEQVGAALSKAGDEGLTMAELMQQSNISRGAFIRAIVDGTKTGLFEQIGAGDEVRIRLTAQGKSLY
jgi:hypothetical protein